MVIRTHHEGLERSWRNDSFAALYEEHFQGIYDFVGRIVRSRDLAADVVQTTFANAWAKWRDGSQVRDPKPWLYAIAHNAAIDELRARRRETASEDPTESSTGAELDASRLSDPQAVIEDAELAELVWSAAKALSPQDYSLLHLHLREDLSADELATHLHLRRGAVYTRLSRMRDSLEDGVRLTLIARRGRGDCPELDELLERRRATSLTPALRRELRAHIEMCERCQQSRGRYAPAAEIFAALAPLPVAVGLHEEIWGAVSASHAAGHAAVAGHAAHHAPVSAKGAAALAALAAAVAATVLAISGGPSQPQDPAGIHSSDHRVGVASTDRTVTMAWARRSGATGYSVLWSRNRAVEPRPRVNLPGRSTGATSPPLATGSWYFILRTENRDGRWTDTSRVGPFVIVAATTVRHVTTRSRAKTRKRRDARTTKRIAGIPTAAPLTLAAGASAPPRHRSAKPSSGTSPVPPSSPAPPSSFTTTPPPATPSPPEPPPSPPKPPPQQQPPPTDTPPGPPDGCPPSTPDGGKSAVSTNPPNCPPNPKTDRPGGRP